MDSAGRSSREPPSHAPSRAAAEPVAHLGAVGIDLSPRGAEMCDMAQLMRDGPAASAQRERREEIFGSRTNRTGLPDALKSGVEALSGISLDGVRVHFNSPRPAQLRALAFAQDADIHLGPGQEHHLPHEAWHVVQQAQGRVRAGPQMKDGVPINDEADLEREADLMGALALTTPAAPPPPPDVLPRGGPVQRVTAQILPDREEPKEDGVIGSIAIVGRPESAHAGTMGDHTTAFVALQKGLEMRLAGLNLDQASTLMAELSGELTKLPGYGLVGELPERQAAQLDTAWAKLNEATAYFRTWRRQARRDDNAMDSSSEEDDAPSADAPDHLAMAESDAEVEASEVNVADQGEPLRPEESDPDSADMHPSAPEDGNHDDADAEGLEPAEEERGRPDAAAVGWMQHFVECYLQVRELIPLTTVNTKAVGAALAGKGKGEDATVLVRAQAEAEARDREPAAEPVDHDGDQGGEPPDYAPLLRTVASLFDPRAVAVVATTTTQEDLNVRAPGVRAEIEPEDRIELMINQHLATLRQIYPAPMDQLRDAGQIRELCDALRASVHAKIEENRAAAGGDRLGQRAGGKRLERLRYLTVNLWIEGGVVKDIKFDGRPKSPFSGTMGAHTSAFIVYKDLIYSSIIDQAPAAACAAMLGLAAMARSHLAHWVESLPADSKQLGLVNESLTRLADCEAGLGAFGDLSTWDQVLELQECAAAVLDVFNATPGATLDVADVNGKREGAHRRVLLAPDSLPAARCRAILGLIDLAGLTGHHATTKQNVEDDMDVQGSREDYWGLNAAAHRDADDAPRDHLPRPRAAEDDIDNDHTADLMRHHLLLIRDAYPGALDGTGLDPGASRETLLMWAQESLEFRDTDEQAFGEEEIDDE